MRIAAIAVGVMCQSLSVAASEEDPKPVKTITAGSNITFFRSDGGLERGYQIATPVTAFGGTALTANYRPALNYTTTLGKSALQINLDINLPTGKEGLSSNEQILSVDPLILRFDRYSEGINVSIGGTVIQHIGTTGNSIGSSLTYINRGHYKPYSGDDQPTLDPSDRLISALQWLYEKDGLTADFTARGIFESATSYDGEYTFDRGNVFVLSAAMAKALTPTINLQSAVSWQTSTKDERYSDMMGDLAEDSERANGDALTAAAHLSWLATTHDLFHAGVNYTHIEANAFNEVDLEFRPERKKGEVEIGYKRLSRNGWSTHLKANYFRLDNGVTLGFEHEDYKGGNITATFNRNFQ